MSTSTSLVVRGLCRSYGQLQALRGLDLAVGAGTCVALVGHNGCGKTTAVRTIAGLLEPSAGTVEVCGACMHDERGAPGARREMAVVPDAPVLYGDLTVAEHLRLVATAHGVADAGLGGRIDRLLARLDLGSRRDALPRELSRGMRQKAQLACALIRPFSVLLLDEPVVGLDSAGQRALREVLAEAKGRGAAIVLTTHQLGFARGVADRGMLLEDGQVIEEGGYEAVVRGDRAHERGMM